jgi:ribonuclease P protein subunit RPR2
MRARRKKPDYQVKIAKERIEKLMELARKEFEQRPERSERYVGLAKKIGMRYTVRLPRDMKREFCKSCNVLLVPGRTSQVRIDSRKRAIIIKCKKCNRIYKIPYKKGRKK